MEIRYIPDSEFPIVVKELKAKLRNVGGRNRWIVNQNDEEYIIRPASSEHGIEKDYISKESEGTVRPW